MRTTYPRKSAAFADSSRTLCRYTLLFCSLFLYWKLTILDTFPDFNTPLHSNDTTKRNTSENAVKWTVFHAKIKSRGVLNLPLDSVHMYSNCYSMCVIHYSTILKFICSINTLWILNRRQWKHERSSLAASASFLSVFFFLSFFLSWLGSAPFLCLFLCVN